MDLINNQPASGATAHNVSTEIANKLAALASVARSLKAPQPVTEARAAAVGIGLAMNQLLAVETTLRTVEKPGGGFPTSAEARAQINADMNLMYRRYGGSHNFVAGFAAAVTAVDQLRPIVAAELFGSKASAAADNLEVATFTPSAALVAACDAVLGALAGLPGA